MKPTPLNRLVLAVVAACCAAAADAATMLVQDVRVFDGQAVHAHRAVLLRDGVIADANYRGQPPAGARIVPGAGRTLLPGLIDAHVHAFQHFELPLVFGVTTEIDMFTSVAVMQQIAKAMATGQNHEAADVFSAGTLVTAPGGHGTEFTIPIPTLAKGADVQAFVDARIAEGSHFIKIVMEEGVGAHRFESLDAATVQAIVAAAHRRGKLAVVHISTLADARAALEAFALGPAAEHVLALALREAVTNVVRHAAATRCTLGLALEGSSAVLRVTDDGHGLGSGTDVRAGNGLAGMRERAVAAGGRLSLSVDAGLRLELRVPAGAPA